jgi:hypothetical protein
MLLREPKGSEVLPAHGLPDLALSVREKARIRHSPSGHERQGLVRRSELQGRSDVRPQQAHLYAGSLEWPDLQKNTTLFAAFWVDSPPGQWFLPGLYRFKPKPPKNPHISRISPPSGRSGWFFQGDKE